jgi:RHH-type proline utilization regulon transcriptional repressor/proline dehydrogenase/delta 1-pyrroline-5-carboxylate dehydrogenase
MVRLVKGAYWDTEIKAAQVAGLDDYPVFTRKVATDVSYIACAKRLLAAATSLPAFATHNANTIGAIKALAGAPIRIPAAARHGRGLYEELAEAGAGIGERGRRSASTRRSAATRNLLAYLVRRLLENGANRSFVNRIADEQMSLDRLVAIRSPSWPRSTRSAIPRSACRSDFRRGAPQQRRGRPVRSAGPRAAARAARTHGGQGVARADARKQGQGRDVTAPFDRSIVVGRVVEAASRTSTAPSRLPLRAAGLGRAGRRGAGAAARSRRRPVREHREEFFSLCMREAGKTLVDAVLEVREAVDFLRLLCFRSAAPRSAGRCRCPADGELNQLRLHGRGVFACISPGISRWRFSPARSQRHSPPVMLPSPSRPNRRR